MRSLLHCLIPAFAGGLAILASACAPETGILIKVTATEEVWSAAVPDGTPAVLELYVGVEDEALSQTPTATECGTAPHYLQTDELRGIREDLADRNLAREPFTLFLRPDDALVKDPEILIMAVVENPNAPEDEPARRVLLSATVSQPVFFVDGVLQRWTLELIKPSDPSATGECVCTGTATGNAIISTGVDPDCDGYTEDDCGPTNPLQHPGATELCDGLDTNCEPGDAPEGDQRCFGQDSPDQPCFTGWLACLDDENPDLPAEQRGACTQPTRELVGEAPDALCSAYEELQSEPDPFQAAVARVYSGARTLSCKLPLTEQGTVCQGATAVLARLQAEPFLGCSWHLVGGSRQQHYVVDIIPSAEEDDLDPLLCPALLVVRDANQTSDEARADTLLLWNERLRENSEESLEYVRVELEPGEKGDCTQLVMACTES